MENNGVLYTGTSELHIPQRVASATKRIIFHAGVYGNFANFQEHRRAMEAYLAKPDVTLDILAVEWDQTLSWFDEFATMLRQEHSIDELREHFEDSWKYVQELERAANVRVHKVRQMPCAPMLIFDDTLVAGFYLHSTITAPEGYWIEQRGDVDKMLGSRGLSSEELRKQLNPQELSMYRFVDECVQASCGQLLCLS
ncbi:MAG: hypothetical protein ACNI27_15610 [Desulfovibrio sp.]